MIIQCNIKILIIHFIIIACIFYLLYDVLITFLQHQLQTLVIPLQHQSHLGSHKPGYPLVWSSRTRPQSHEVQLSETFFLPKVYSIHWKKLCILKIFHEKLLKLAKKKRILIQESQNLCWDERVKSPIFVNLSLSNFLVHSAITTLPVLDLHFKYFFFIFHIKFTLCKCTNMVSKFFSNYNFRQEVK